MPTDLLSCLVLVAAYTPPDCRLEDRQRFASQDVAVANLRIARSHRCWLESNVPLSSHRYDAWREACRDAKRISAFGGWRAYLASRS